MKLRSYQEEAVRSIVRYAAEHPQGRLLLVMAPRAGKTLTAATAAKLMTLDQNAPGQRELRVLWVAPSVEPLDEAVEHLIACGIPEDQIGVIYRNRPTRRAAPFQVGTEGTIDLRNKPEADLVISDEAHHDPAARRRRIRAFYPNAFHLGLTGTPERLTGAGLERDYDEMLVPVQPSELIHDEHLAVPTVFAPEDAALPKLRQVRVRRGDYDQRTLEKMMLTADHLDRLVREWDRLAERRRTIVFPVTIKHSLAIVDAFQGHHINAFHLDGDTPAGDREEILDGLRSGEIDVVSSVGVLSEALNMPPVKCVVMARPTRSLRLHIQQGSRCMTPWNGVRPRILDTVGNCRRHGFPFDDHPWTLAARARAKGESHPMVKRCPAPGCGALAALSVRVCAVCGITFADFAPPVPPLPPVKLQVVEFTLSQVAAKRAQLEAFAAHKGFDGAWVEKVIRAMLGGEAA